MQPYSVQDSVTLDTQVSVGGIVSNFQQHRSRSEISQRNRRPKLMSKIGIRYYFHQFIQYLLIPYVSFIIYLSVVITAGVLVVYLTANQKPLDVCPATYKVLITDVNSRDSTPQYVVMGDVNNDTHLDILVVTTGIDSIKIYLSQANGSFIDHLTLSTGLASQPSSAVFGHFNDDRCLDIAVANYASHAVMIFIGDCHGQFRNHSIYSTGPSQPMIIKAGDLNTDRWLDLVVTNNGTDSVSVLIGYGDGTFVDPVGYLTAFDSFPHDVALDDVNNDGFVDLIVANSGTDSIGIHFGYGNGSFAPQMTLWTGIGSRPYSLALADLNQDHKLDIAVANTGTGTVTLLSNYKNGTFLEKLTVSTNISGPVQLAIDDINGDIYKDLVIVSALNNSLHAVLGYGDGTFGEQRVYSTDLNSEPWSLALTDVNCDNRTDVVIANYGTNNVGVLFGYDPGLFRDQTTYSTGQYSYPWSAVLDDVNNDEILDIINVHVGDGHVGIFIGYGNGTFAAELVYSTGSDSQPHALSTGDFNEDSRLDIVVTNRGTDNIGIFLGYGNGTFQRQEEFSTGPGSGPLSVDVGDFNRDSHLDIVVANEKTENVGLFLGYGNGSFAKQRTFSTGASSRPMSLITADFNNDQQIDIAVAYFSASIIGVFLGYGTGNFTHQLVYLPKSNPPFFIAVGDVNNDHQVDIIFLIKTHYIESVGVLIGFGNGTFQSLVTYPSREDSSPYGLTIGDFNDDHYQDIVVANSNLDNIGIFFGYGNGTFAPQRAYFTGEDWFPTTTTIGDLNNDGRLDIVVVNCFACNMGVFLGYNYGTLTNPLTYSTGSSAKPQSLAVIDFNHDGQLDIVSANFGSNTLSVRMKSTNEIFANEIRYQTGTDSLPNAVIVADFNKDSNMDIAVANFGNDNIGLYLGLDNETFEIGNFVSTGSDSQPCAIAVGDVNNDTRMDIVVSKYAANSLGVFIGHQYPNHRMEEMVSMGLNFSPYRTSVGDLNNDNHMDAVVVDFEFSSMAILLGYGNGKFAAPIMYPDDFGLQPYVSVIADFNNDKQLDIAVCLLSHGISLYLGYGNGTMASPKIHLIGNQSEPQSISAGDFNNDNWIDIALAVNSETDYVIVLLGHGDGTFGNQTSYSGAVNSYGLSMLVGDFNNDYHLDIVVANPKYSNIGVFLGYGNGTFEPLKTYSTGSESGQSSISAGDLNNDTHLDLVVTNRDGMSISIFSGYGNGSFADPMTLSVDLDRESEPSSAVISDFNKDNLLDIAVALPYTNKIVLFLGYGNNIFEIVRVYDTDYNSSPAFIVADDFNHDAVVDILVANTRSQSMGVFMGFCCDLFLLQKTFSTGIDSGPHSVILGDFNSDDILDVAVANLQSENIGVLLGHGNGTFHEQIIYPTGLGSRPYALTVGDCNNDTHLDIFVANYGTETIGVLLGYGNGTFTNYTIHSTGLGSRPNAISVLDFNNDNRLDIAITNDGTDNVAILFGDGHGSFEELITYRTGYNTQPCAITSGDYNNDAEMDIFVSECGSNNIGVISKFC